MTCLEGLIELRVLPDIDLCHGGIDHQVTHVRLQLKIRQAQHSGFRRRVTYDRRLARETKGQCSGQVPHRAHMPMVTRP